MSRKPIEASEEELSEMNRDGKKKKESGRVRKRTEGKAKCQEG